jgi:hypothetical protein
MAAQLLPRNSRKVVVLLIVLFKNDEIDTKQPKTLRKIHTSLVFVKKNKTKPKVSRLLSNVCDFRKES